MEPTFDAYSVKWTGASQVNPEYEAVAMEKAMRWAILSAEEVAEPVLTAFVLPWWDDKGSSYARWLSHHFLIVANEAGLQHSALSVMLVGSNKAVTMQ